MTKPSPRQIDKAYLAKVRALPCCVCESDYQVQAHHAGKRGIGRKADDTTAIPLCLTHHHQLHALSGYFIGWVKVQRRGWELQMIDETRKKVNP